MGFFTKRKLNFNELVGQIIVHMEVLNDEHKIVFQATKDGNTFTDYILWPSSNGRIDLIDGDPAEVLIDCPVTGVEVVQRTDVEDGQILWHKYRIETGYGRVEIFIFDAEEVDFYC